MDSSVVGGTRSGRVGVSNENAVEDIQLALGDEPRCGHESPIDLFGTWRGGQRARIIPVIVGEGCFRSGKCSLESTKIDNGSVTGDRDEACVDGIGNWGQEGIVIRANNEKDSKNRDGL